MKKLITILAALFLLVEFTSADEAVKSRFADTYFLFDGGVSFIQVNRIQKQTERSNFLWRDCMIGAYFKTQTRNLPYVDFLLRIQGFYPFYHQFNGMEMISKQTILYAFDGFLGPTYRKEMYKYFNMSLTPGIHYMYQLSDEYHYSYVGGGVILGMEFPVHKSFTILLDGTFTWDSANFGTNKNVQPYDYSWQWQSSLGVRYHPKHPNFASN